MILSILIPTIPERHESFMKLQNELWRQIGEKEDIEIITTQGHGISIGEKRNSLMERATGKYLCFIDDDDWIAENYISTIISNLNNDPDCLSLRGIITTDGENPEIFEHSLKYTSWETWDGAITYIRTPNHLNVLRSSIAKQIKFPNIYFGEDHNFSNALFNSGLLKKENYIDQVLYYYKYISKK